MRYGLSRAVFTSHRLLLMSYRVDYFLGDQQVASAAIATTLKDAIRIAWRVLGIINADIARIRDMNASGAEVAIISSD